MGNYHQYETECHTKDIVIPDVAFFNEYAVHGLIVYGWEERKHWDKFDVDMKLVSLHNPNILITIKETDEDETIHRQHQFYNGEHKSVDAVVTYPEIIW